MDQNQLQFPFAEDIFWGFGNNKSKRLYFCQTGGMSLWIALELAALYARGQTPSHKQYRNAVKSFPYSVGSCRCKDCRYFRIISK